VGGSVVGSVVVGRRTRDRNVATREFDSRPVYCRLPGNLGQLSLPFLLGESSTSLLAGLRWDAFTCVGWQVTLCDCNPNPIMQVMPRSSRTLFSFSFNFSFNFNSLFYKLLLLNRPDVDADDDDDDDDITVDINKFCCAYPIVVTVF